MSPSSRVLLRYILFLIFLSSAPLGRGEDFVSPNKRFTAYTVANSEKSGGVSLYLKRNDAQGHRVTLASNLQYVEVAWSSPDSSGIAISAGLDSHNSYIDVFEIAVSPGGELISKLDYSTRPLGTKDLRWTIVDWDSKTRILTLLKQSSTKKSEFLKIPIVPTAPAI